MNLFRRKAAPEMVPDNMTAVLMDVLDMPPADAYCPEAPRWITREEHERRAEEERANMPSVEELLEDPDIAAVVEAAGENACKFTIDDR